MTYKFIFPTVAALTLVAFGFMMLPSVAHADSLKSAISGKSLHSDGAVIKLRKNGKLTGKLKNGDKLTCAWTVRNGQFCRTLTAPEAAVGTECQKAVLGDVVVTIAGQRGPIEWQLK